MSIRQRLRFTQLALIGALLVASFSAALQVWELTADDVRAPTPSLEEVGARSRTAAVALGLTGALALTIAAIVLRSIQTALLHRLEALDEAAVDIVHGDEARRATVDDDDDELTRIAQALNFALDSRDRVDAEMHGRNRDIRALLVALLQLWPNAAAIISFDGIVLASTLSSEAEEQLHSLTPQLRQAAGTLLARGFAAATETDVRSPNGAIFRVRALALDEQRLVGWLGEYTSSPTSERSG